MMTYRIDDFYSREKEFYYMIVFSRDGIRIKFYNRLFVYFPIVQPVNRKYELHMQFHYENI